MKVLAALMLIAITSPALADHYAFGPKATAPRTNTNSTVWDAYCPSGTTVIAISIKAANTFISASSPCRVN